MLCMRIASLVLSAALLLPACHRAGPALDEAQDAVASSGLKVEGFHPIQPGGFSAKECREGKAEGLDVVICAYGSLDARARGEKAAEGWIANAVTGTTATRDLPEGRSGSRW